MALWRLQQGLMTVLKKKEEEERKQELVRITSFEVVA